MNTRDMIYTCNAGMIYYEIRGKEESTESYAQKKGGEIRITGYKGNAISLRIPEEIQGVRVTAIGKKAFLSAAQIEEIELPDSVENIEDWAFASCRKLRRISLKKESVHFGRGVFKGSKVIQEIELRSENGEIRPGLGFLFAAGFSLLDTPYLTDALQAGSRQWYEIWDGRMRMLMDSSDTTGFSQMLMCGVEDYGSRENTLEHYTHQKRLNKSRVAFLRLRYPHLLADEDRSLLEQFLRSHTKGCESEEAWEILKEEHGDDASYYRLFSEVGAVSEKNRKDMVADLGEQHTELKAYLLKQENAKEDFFDFLSL